MGTGIRINPRNTKELRVSTRLLIDVPLLVATILLLIIGLLLLYSASWSYSLQRYDSGTYIVLRQATWIFIGLVLAALMMFLNYHVLEKFSVWILAGAIFFLFIVLLDPSGSSAAGYTRSLTGGGSIQPSEFARVALIIYLAYWLSKKQANISTLMLGFIPTLFIIGIVALLILLQPDISATLSVVLLGGLMLFVAGGNMKHIFGVLFLAICLGFCGYFLFDKVETRINDYINGLVNPSEASYHIRRSYNAIINGGVFGLGLGKGVAKLTGLPVAWTDSIFAVLLEEMGLVGGTIVIGLYVLILWRGYDIFKKAPDMFGKLLAAGITLWITLEASINVAVMLNIMPFAGNALPLISFGGSSMVCTLIGIGILMSVSRYSAIEAIKKGRSEPDALIDLRGRDGGWRKSRIVSRSGRS